MRDRLPEMLRIPSGRGLRLVLGAEAIVGIGIVVGLLDADEEPVLTLPRLALAVVVVLALMALTTRAGDGSRVTRAGAGALGLLLGIVGLAAGAIVGITGFAIGGPSPAVAFGVLLLASGLILTLTSTGWLLGSVGRWWRLLGLPIGYLVFQFWLMPVTMAVLGTHMPRPVFTAQIPAGAQRVELTESGTVPLVGWYTPSTNGAAVIVLAGAGSTKADTTAQASVLSKRGYGVLALDLRGTGESGGQSMLWGWGGDLDVRRAVDWLTQRSDVDPDRIGVLGLSMGGEVAITSMNNARVRAVVAEGATGRTCGDLTFLGSDVEGTIHRADSCLGWFLAGLINRESAPTTLASVIAAHPDRPLLLIAADLPEEHAATEAWRARSPETIQLWEPVGAAHTGALATDSAEWERRVIDFLDRTLR